MVARLCARVLVVLITLPFTEPFASLKLGAAGRATCGHTVTLTNQTYSSLQLDAALGSRRSTRRVESQVVQRRVPAAATAFVATFAASMLDARPVFDPPIRIVLRR